MVSKPEPSLPDRAFAIEQVTREQADALIGTMRLTDDARKAKNEWNTDVLLWGREGWQQVDRLCRAAKTALPDMTVICRRADED